MEQFVIIVHPLKKIIEWYEKRIIDGARLFPERRYSEDSLFPFRRYDGYKRVFILPGKADQPQLPDMDALSERIELGENDKVLSDGKPVGFIIREAVYLKYDIDLENVPEKNLEYPDFGKVAENVIQLLDLTPNRRFLPFHAYPPDLIFGGHHSSDCVRKLALEFKKRNFKPYIDPLITELYYRCWPNIDNARQMKIKL